MAARRNALFILVATLLLAVAAPASPQKGPRTLQVNLDYRVIAPQRVATSDKIEVIDFFWYGCPTCNLVQPALEAWNKRKPTDVELRRIPAIRHEAWAPHARIFYTLETLGEIERLHQEVYRGYHVEQLHMSKPDVMEQWAVRHGIPSERWVSAYTAASTDGQVRHASELTRLYDVRGTPSFIIDGRYLTSASMAYTVEDLIFIIDGLVAKARAERAGQSR